MPLLIDAHLDLAWNALSFNRDQTWAVDQIRESEAGMTDEPSRGRNTVSLPDKCGKQASDCVLPRSWSVADWNKIPVRI